MKPLFFLLCVSAVLAQGPPPYRLPTTTVPQSWRGSGPPGAVPGNLTGDFYYDQSTSPVTQYVCTAPYRNGTVTVQPPACSSVTAGEWQVTGTGSSPGGNAGGALSGSFPNPGFAYRIYAQGNGAICNSSFDNTTILNNLFASAPAGTTIDFSCIGGGNFNVSGEVDFTGFHTYSGNGITSTSTGRIVSSYSGNVAFKFKNSPFVTLENIALFSSNVASPPKTIMAMGYSITPSNFFRCIACSILGRATVAAVYSIASEEQDWVGAFVDTDGSGPGVPIYYDYADSQNIDSFTSGSNTAIRWSGSTIQDLSSTAAYVVKLMNTGGNTGDITFRDSYLEGIGKAFFLDSAISSIVIDAIRFENGTWFAEVPSSSTVYGVAISNSRVSSGAALGFMTGGASSIFSSYMELHNDFYPTSLRTTLGSTIPGANNSVIIEPFLVISGTGNPIGGTTNTVISGTAGAINTPAVQLGINATGQPVCSGTTRGTITDVQTATVDALSMCQRIGGVGNLYVPIQSGSYTTVSVPAAAATLAGRDNILGDELLEVDPSGTIASLTINLEPADTLPIGSIKQISFSQIVTTLTLSPSAAGGGSINGTALVSAAVNSSVAYKKTASKTWRRLY